MMLPGCQYLLTLAVGPADVSIDWSAVNGVSGPVGPTGQSHPEADEWGPRSGRVKEKEKGLGSGFWAESVTPDL
jgi:hypothetical protein